MKCLSCSLEKMRQKNIPKKNENTATKPGERMYLDISSIKDERFSGRKHWAMLVDKATKCKHSFILKKKLDQIEMISSWLRGLKDKYKIQGGFCCDNAGENKKLEEKCNADTSTKCACQESHSNDNGVSMSNDEFCRIYNREA